VPPFGPKTILRDVPVNDVGVNGKAKLPDQSDQFLRRLKDQDTIIGSDEVGDPVNDLMVLFGTARGGTIFYAHWLRMFGIPSIYFLLADKLAGCPPNGGTNLPIFHEEN
jgi:hypothetical protein